MIEIIPTVFNNCETIIGNIKQDIISNTDSDINLLKTLEPLYNIVLKIKTVNDRKYNPMQLDSPTYTIPYGPSIDSSIDFPFFCCISIPL